MEIYTNMKKLKNSKPGEWIGGSKKANETEAHTGAEEWSVVEKDEASGVMNRAEDMGTIEGSEVLTTGEIRVVDGERMLVLPDDGIIDLSSEMEENPAGSPDLLAAVGGTAAVFGAMPMDATAASEVIDGEDDRGTRPDGDADGVVTVQERERPRIVEDVVLVPRYVSGKRLRESPDTPPSCRAGKRVADGIDASSVREALDRERERCEKLSRELRAVRESHRAFEDKVATLSQELDELRRRRSPTRLLERAVRRMVADALDELLVSGAVRGQSISAGGVAGGDLLTVPVGLSMGVTPDQTAEGALSPVSAEIQRMRRLLERNDSAAQIVLQGGGAGAGSTPTSIDLPAYKRVR